MSLFTRTLLTALLLLAAGAPVAAASGRFIVVYERSVPSVGRETNALEKEEGFKSRLRFSHAVKGFSARLDAEQVAALERDPQVAAVVPDRMLHARAFVPLAAGEPVPLPGMRRIEAATATTVREAATSPVAVIDTGIDLDHPDLDVADGTNCISPGKPADDDDGHGTHVAGTIAAKNNGSGVVGVAPGTKVYAVKVLDADGSGSWSQIICGIDWVTANAAKLGIRVANLSLGGTMDKRSTCTTASDPLHGAICRAAQAGVLSVVAAGNDGWDLGKDPVDVPAAYPEVLTVTAMTDTDGRAGAAGRTPTCKTGQADDSYATFSNYSTRAEDLAHMIAAPGVCIRSTMPGGTWGLMSGTSMATPHVAGAAALCLGEAGEEGPCASLTPAAMIGALRDESQARYTLGSYGFNGDPMKPLTSGRAFGRLAHVMPPGGPTAPAEGTPAEPAPTPETGTPAEPASTTGPGKVKPVPPPSEPVSEEPAAEQPAAEQPAAEQPAAEQPVSEQPADESADIPLELVPPTATLLVPRQRLRSALRRGLVVWVDCSESCSVQAGLARVAPARPRIASAGAQRVVLRFYAAQRRALWSKRSARVRVRVTDAAGHWLLVERRISLRR